MVFMKRLFPLLMFACFACAWLSVASAQQAQEVSEEDEITIRLKGVDGKTYDISQMRGSVVLVSFGATWCQPCAKELRALEELKDEYRDKPVKFLWIDIQGENEISDGKLRDFAKSLGLTFPVLRDPTKFTFGQFTERVRIPLVVFFDKAGNFVAPKHVGMSTPEEYKTRMRSRLDQLLALQPDAGSVSEK